MTNFRITAIVLSLLTCVVIACAPVVRNYGYTPSDEDLSVLELGVADKVEVRTAIGAPAAANSTYGDDWFYVANDFVQEGISAPRETDRRVVVVSFDDEGKLSNVARYGLQDGRAVALSRRVTETNLGRLNLIQQMLRSLGRIDPTSAFDQN